MVLARELVETTRRPLLRTEAGEISRLPAHPWEFVTAHRDLEPLPALGQQDRGVRLADAGSSPSLSFT